MNGSQQQRCCRGDVASSEVPGRARGVRSRYSSIVRSLWPNAPVAPARAVRDATWARPSVLDEGSKVVQDARPLAGLLGPYEFREACCLVIIE
jgi:hypothetical protein